MQIFDFPKVILWQFSKKSKNSFHSSVLALSKRFFLLDRVWRPKTNKNMLNKVSHHRFRGGSFCWKKREGPRDFRMTSSGLEKNYSGQFVLFLF